MRGSCQIAGCTALLAAVAALGLLHAPWARGETIVVDGKVQVVKSDLPRPTGGMSMDAVQKRFGAPRERHEAVGTPPITRWDYQSFAVFFEKDRVIDAVVTTPDASATPAPVTAQAPPEAASTPPVVPAPTAAPTASPAAAPSATPTAG